MRRRASHVIRPVRAGVVRFRLAALFAAQFFDLGTFSLMVDRHGVAAEVNPIVAQGFADWGMVLVVVAKLALVLLVGSVVVLLADNVFERSRGRGIHGRRLEPRGALTGSRRRGAGRS